MGVLNKDIWHKEAKNLTQRNNVQPRRWGMMVTVTEDGTAANNTTWVLVRSLVDTNKNNNSNWQTIAAWLKSIGVSTVPKTAIFNGDGVTLDFVIADAEDIQIHSVFVGGQRYREGTDFTKDNDTKTVTFLGDPVPNGVGIDVEYFSGAVSVIDITTLSAAQLQQLATDLAPYLL